MDAIIVLGDGSKHGNDELRICLRSIDRYYADLDRVFISGYIPDFVQQSATCIPVPNTIYTGRNWKDVKMWEQAITVLTRYSVSDEFLLLNDDQFITREMHDSDFRPMWLKEYDPADNEYAETPWKRALRRELIMFRHLNRRSYYWQPHIWSRFNKADFTGAFFDSLNRGIADPVMYSYIYNYAGVEATEENRNHDHRFFGKANWQEAIKDGFTTGHVAYCDNAFDQTQFRNLCFSMFPEKSKFEKA